MYNRWFRSRKSLVLLALAGFVVALLPDMAGAVAYLFSSGTAGLALAKLAADVTLLVALALGLIGVAGQRSWGRWIGRGVGLYWLARVIGGFAVYGTIRPLEVLAFFGGGVLLISLPPPERAYEGGASAGPSWRRWLGGWGLAFNVGLIPVLLAPINRTVANALGDSLLTVALVASALASIIAFGTLLVLGARTFGLLLCAVADLAALIYFWQLVIPRDLGHHELLLLGPATFATVIAAAALSLPDLRAVNRRSNEPIL